MSDFKNDIYGESVKSVPAVGGAAYSYFTLNEWVAIATIIYIIIQVFILIQKHVWAVKDRKSDQNENQ